MFDHIGIVTDDLTRSGRFYDIVLASLGYRRLETNDREGGTGRLVFGTGAPASPFFVVAAGRPMFWEAGHAPSRSPIHLAFRAPSREAVDSFHAAGMEFGARSNGDPGIRRDPYYCAFLIDPDDNNLEAGLYLERASAADVSLPSARGTTVASATRLIAAAPAR